MVWAGKAFPFYLKKYCLPTKFISGFNAMGVVGIGYEYLSHTVTYSLTL